MTKEERYRDIRTKLASGPSTEKLPLLKEHFRKKIDSDRRFDRITNLMELIRILEKRDVINVDDLSSVKYIAELLQNDDVIKLIKNFTTPENYPMQQNVDIQTPSVRQAEPIRQNIAVVAALEDIGRVLPIIDSDPIKRVYDTICSGLGSKWKEFARALRIREGYIDELEAKHKNQISEMVREIITYHRTSCDPRYWKCELSNALIDARRRDLSRDVDRIFAMHS